MVDTSQIRNGLAVIASDAEPVGAVDAVEGDRLKLTRKDSTDNIHHYIPLAWVARVEERIHLNRTGAEVRASWGHDRAAGAGGAAAPGARGERKTSWLLWVVLGLVLLGLLWVLSNRDRDTAATTETVTTETETVVEPGEAPAATPPER